MVNVVITIARIPKIKIEYNENYFEKKYCKECGYFGRIKVKETFDFTSFHCGECEKRIN